MPELKNAHECNSIDEIRAQIDKIDQEIINLFAKRYEYVKEVVKFKDKTEDAIIASERKELVIKQRSEWAAAHGLDKDAFATLFKQLVEHNISKEMEILEESK